MKQEFDNIIKQINSLRDKVISCQPLGQTNIERRAIAIDLLLKAKFRIIDAMDEFLSISE